MYDSFLSAVLFYGAFIISIILLSIACYQSLTLFKKITMIKLKKYWFILSVLIVLFCCAYIAVVVLAYFNQTDMVLSIAWFVFMMGAAFVLICVGAGVVNYASFLSAKKKVDEEIEHVSAANKELEETSKAVADANVNIAMLYSELEETRDQLTEKEQSLREQNEGLYNVNKSLADANANMAQLYVELEEAKKELQDKNKALVTANKDVNTLNNLAQVVNSSLVFNEVAESFMTPINDIFKFNVVTLHIFDKKTELIHQDRAYGLTLHPDEIKAIKEITISLATDESLVVDTIKRAQPIYIEDLTTLTSGLSKVDDELQHYIKWQSVVYFPLMVRSQVIGCAGFYNLSEKMLLTEEDILKTQKNLVLASTAINNAKIYSDLQKAKIQLAETEKIKALTSVFRKFVPQQFLKKIAKKGIEHIEFGNADLTELSMLFVDIRNFTHLSETVSEPTLYKYVNEYFKYMCSCIYSCNGFVDKFIGDGILALFDIDESYEHNAATNAVLAAIKMQQSLVAFNKNQSASIPNPTEMGIGIHCGDVLMGTVGMTEHYESTVLGENVNIAARIEQLTKVVGTDIIISEATLSKIDPAINFKYRPLGFVTVKGINVPISIFEVYEHNSEKVQKQKDATNSALEEAFHELKDKNYQVGLQLLKQIHATYPEDLIVKRIYTYNLKMYEKS